MPPSPLPRQILENLGQLLAAGAGHEIDEQGAFGVLEAFVREEAGEFHLAGRGEGGDRDEVAAGQMLGDFEHRFEDHAATRQRPDGQHVAIVGFVRARDLKAARAIGGFERPDEFALAGKAQQQAIMATVDQILTGEGHAAAFDIGGGGAEHAAAIGDGADAQVGILGQTEHEGDIEPLGHHIHPAVAEPQSDIDLGVEILEQRDQRRDQAFADAERGRDMDRAARAERDGGDGGLGLVDGVEDLAGALVEDIALFGRLQAARRAAEQAGAEVFFQFGDARADHGGRDALIAAGGGHAAQFEHADEGTQVVYIGHGAVSQFTGIFESATAFAPLASK